MRQLPVYKFAHGTIRPTAGPYSIALVARVGVFLAPSSSPARLVCRKRRRAAEGTATFPGLMWFHVVKTALGCVFRVFSMC